MTQISEWGGGGMSSGLFINDTQIVSYFTENELSFNTECLYVIFLLSCLQLAYYYHFFCLLCEPVLQGANSYSLPFARLGKQIMNALKTLPLEERNYCPTLENVLVYTTNTYMYIVHAHKCANSEVHLING